MGIGTRVDELRRSGIGEALELYPEGMLMFSGRGEGEGGERRVTRDGLTGAAVRQSRKRSVHEEYRGRGAGKSSAMSDGAGYLRWTRPSEQGNWSFPASHLLAIGARRLRLSVASACYRRKVAGAFRLGLQLTLE